MDTEETENPLESGMSLITLLGAAIIANGGEIVIKDEDFQELVGGGQGTHVLLDFDPENSRLRLHLGNQEEEDNGNQG